MTEAGTNALLGPADIRRLAEELDVRPTKKLGQNFVHDPNTVRRIVTTAALTPDDVVLEIGPGLGSLTLALLPAAQRVVAVEIDPVLAQRLPRTVAERAPDLAQRLTVINADALRITANQLTVPTDPSTPTAVSSTGQPAATPGQPGASAGQPAASAGQPAATDNQPASPAIQHAEPAGQFSASASEEAGSAVESLVSASGEAGSVAQSLVSASGEAGSAGQSLVSPSQEAAAAAQSPVSATSIRQPASSVRQPAALAARPARSTGPSEVPVDQLAYPTALVANLPYNVSVPVVLHLLAELPTMTKALVMVQAEVADRMAAGPGAKVYGVPSVKIAWYAEARRVATVPRSVFWPVPNVDSALVLLTRRPTPDADREALFKLVDAAFSQRRKTLRAALATWAGSADRAAEILTRAGVDPAARGETLTVSDYAAITRTAGKARP